ncbi:hypothetical protein SAMN05720615_11032 [Stenotrophomonas indicatrix]|nr:hypothetical protein SAMN05720615_11032 [Stenotrophomonas indicatrix]
MMSRAAVLIGLAVLLVMVLAAIAEWASRVHTGLASLRRSSTLRMLDPEEYSALAPLRALTGCVHDDQVKRLRGAFTGGACWNNFPVGDGLLGGVPVLVPRRAWPYLSEDNQADVVLDERVAVVVRLNGFNIAAARPDAATSRVCGERMETPEEVSMRRGPGLRPSPLVIAALALWAAAGVPGLLATPLLAIAGLAAWLGRPRRNGPATAQRVLRVRGRLLVYRRTAQASQVWLLGNDRRVQLPEEWEHAQGFSRGRSMLLDVRTCDGWVLGAGTAWCLASDRRRYPPTGAFWHLAWLGLLLCVLMFGAAWMPLSQRLDLGWPVASAWQPLAVLAVGWHTVRLVVCIVQSVRRSKALGAEIARRPDPWQ